MTKIPPDDILEGLYKLRIRESEKLTTVLELYDLEIHQKKLGPHCHRLKTRVKRSIEQDIRDKNFGIRNGNYEKNAVVKKESRNKTACTKSTIPAQRMEETSRRGILGRHQSCDSERIDILSNSIECNYPSRNTSSFLYSKSCEIEDWRSLI